ncbi:9750_t:CDS:2 [Racocetra persica]|uniref:9750_t:CDS:1 n=1 Tax=Racocetra persica TaxID=160502 RepID=A0ACA9LE29_9GLOM|nr:9750_t:CDS:2 [Racocetra persica]
MEYFGISEECEVEPFDRKISYYVACLETITNNEEGYRRERAQYLLNQYRKASIKDPKPDYKRARNWEREHAYRSIYLHQPIFVDRNLRGTVNNGTIGTVNGIVSRSSKREVQVSDNQDNDKVPKRTRIGYFPVHWRDQQPRTPEHQIYLSGIGFPCIQKNDIENSYGMRFYENNDININEAIYVDKIHLSQKLGKTLSNNTINYENSNRDTVYLHKGVLNLDSSELQEGWYNSTIVAPFFDDCLALFNDCILQRGEVKSKAQKLLGIKSSKKQNMMESCHLIEKLSLFIWKQQPHHYCNRDTNHFGF